MLFSFHVETILYEQQYTVFLLLMLISLPQVKYLCHKVLLCSEDAGASLGSSFPLAHPRAYILTSPVTKANSSPEYSDSPENNLSFPLKIKEHLSQPFYPSLKGNLNKWPCRSSHSFYSSLSWFLPRSILMPKSSKQHDHASIKYSSSPQMMKNIYVKYFVLAEKTFFSPYTLLFVFCIFNIRILCAKVKGDQPPKMCLTLGQQASVSQFHWQFTPWCWASLEKETSTPPPASPSSVSEERTLQLHSSSKS